MQFGDLRLPKTQAPADGFPVAIFIHGGGWSSEWTKDYSNSFVEALTNAGTATWDIEFRRFGNPKADYPNMFADVAACDPDHLREVAKNHPLNLRKIVAVGHSSGGQLALWSACWTICPHPNLRSADPLPLVGVVARRRQ